MFTPELIKARFRGPNFQPVRIIASEGLRFDIYHPDMVLVGEREVIVGLPGKKPGIHKDVARVAIVHIVALEDLPAATPPAGNGKQSSS